MASGDVVGLIYDVRPPAANYPLLTQRAGGSTPAESTPIFAFDASSIEYMDYYGVLANYAGGGLTVTLPWAATSATSGATRWGAAFRAIPDDAEDLDGAHTYDFNDVDDTAASAAGELSNAVITFTNGADMDSLANGEPFIFRVRRTANHANDNMSGDAELTFPIIRET